MLTSKLKAIIINYKSAKQLQSSFDVLGNPSDSGETATHLDGSRQARLLLEFKCLQMGLGFLAAQDLVLAFEVLFYQVFIARADREHPLLFFTEEFQGGWVLDVRLKPQFRLATTLLNHWRI